MEWFGFWIFMAVYIVVDAWLYNKGHDGFFFTHKTPTEKVLQKAIMKRAQQSIGETNNV